MKGLIPNRKDILLVDHDPSLAQTLKMLLETRGYGVRLARSGREALGEVTVMTDLILLEILLPDQDGFEICRQLKRNQNTRHIPIILLTTKLAPESVIQGLYLGADDCVIKPFECEELIARMEAVLRRTALRKDQEFLSEYADQIVWELNEILKQEAIVPFFQPIFLFEPFELLGFEVLTRIQTTGLLSSPDALFKAAIQFGFYHNLEMLVWKKAAAQASPYLDGKKLFLNCNPYLIEAKEFFDIKDIFERGHVDRNQVVLEITERSAITDFNVFYDLLKRYRDHGFQFAIDDVGGGYASLEAIVRTRPEFIKIDRMILSELDQDKYKRSIVKFVVGFCKENGIMSIAEGIETKKEFQNLKALGVEAGQGYYFHKPRPDIDSQAINKIVRQM